MIESGALESLHCLEPFAAAFPASVRDHSNRDERIEGLRAALERVQDDASRDAVAHCIATILPAEHLVPEAYAQWRPLVAEAIAFFLSRLNPARLAPKLVQQFELPSTTPLEVRLSALIASIPALQKAGQILSRNRQIDQALRRELSLLEDAIRDVEFDEIDEIIRRNLSPLFERYHIVLESGIRSEATVSAVVSFQWRNPATGKTERGVFKVLKPRIPEYFAEDLAILEQLSRQFDVKSESRDFALRDFSGVFDEIGRVLKREIDFPQEQRTLAEAGRIYHNMPGVRVPQVIPELCSANITAMSEEPGVKVTATRHLGPDVTLRVTGLLVDALIARPFFSPEQNAMFHADPHPGNLFYDAESQEIVLLDWALTERLGRNERRRLALLGIFTLLRDQKGMVRALRALAVTPSPVDVAAFKLRTGELLVRRPVGLLPVIADITELLDQLAFDGVRFPASLLVFRKMLFTLDGVLQTIAGAEVVPDFTLFRDQLARWLTFCSQAAPPLTARDWFAAQRSALRLTWRAAVGGGFPA